MVAFRQEVVVVRPILHHDAVDEAGMIIWLRRRR